MTRIYIGLLTLLIVVGCDSIRKPKVDNPVLGPPPPRLSMEESALPEYAYIDADAEGEDEGVVQTSSVSDDLVPIPNSNVVATVNGVPVFASDVFERYGNRIDEARAQLPDAEFAQLQRTLIERDLKQHIERKLLSEALRSTLSQQQIDAVNGQLDSLFEEEVERLKKDFDVATRVELENELRARGTSLASVKDAFATQQMATQYIAMNVTRPGSITRQQMVDYYHEHLTDYEFPARVKWQQIRVSQRGRPTADARAKIEDAARALSSGEDFGEVARKFSDGPTAQNGGHWDWTEAGSLADATVAETLSELEPGEISPIFESEFSFQIVKLVEYQPAGRKPFEEVHDEIKTALQKTRQIDPRGVIDDLMTSAVVETKYSYK